MGGTLALGAPTRWARGIVLVAHAVLIAALPALGGMPGALLALPLLAPLRGLWLGRPYTYAWSSMLLCFYVGGFLSEAYINLDVRPTATPLALVAAVEFCALMLFVRFRAAEHKRVAAS